MREEMKTVNIFGVKILNITMRKALDLVFKGVSNNDQRQVFFVNADCLNKAYLDQQYFQVLNNTPYILGDGSGVKVASKFLNTPIIDNVNGTDMLPLLCEQAVVLGYSLFLLGSKPGVADRMKEKLELMYRGIKIAGTHHGYFDRENHSPAVIEIINKSGADILLVAFGAPYQEIWLAGHAELLHCKILMGVGGLFDFYSGLMPRAPLWMRRIGGEWVFRLYQEPGRMWRRYIIGNPLFLLRVLKWKKSQSRG